MLSRSNILPILLTLIAVFFLYYYINSPIQPKLLIKAKRKVNPLLLSWKHCMLQKSESFRGRYVESWDNWEAVINNCGPDVVKKLNVSPFRNKDETKYHILPRVNSSSTVITLGIGRDTEAEKKIREALGKENVEFFGADPIVEVNQKLYSEIGRFFPFAVSDKTGYVTASVYEQSYVFRVVVNVEFMYFLKEMVNRHFYDQILMDTEHGEYTLFPYINKGGNLDQNGVVICQMNMEIHNPDAAKKKLTHDFLFQTIDDERYGFFYAERAAGHYRLYFVNFEDERCQRKYFPLEYQSWE